MRKLRIVPPRDEVDSITEAVMQDRRLTMSLRRGLVKDLESFMCAVAPTATVEAPSLRPTHDAAAYRDAVAAFKACAPEHAPNLDGLETVVEKEFEHDARAHNIARAYVTEVLRQLNAATTT